MNKQNLLRFDPYAQWLLREKIPVHTIEREGKVLFYEFEAHRVEYLRSWPIPPTR